MNTLFISDLHLSAQQTEITTLFYHFLEQEVPQAAALYILGDLFEVWIGDDDDSDYHRQISAALKSASRHTPIYLMRGNRDFLLGEHFAKASGCQLLEEPFLLKLADKKLLLLHGDSLCLLDKAHQRFRRITQHPLAKKAFLYLPLRWRRRIANKIRRLSAARAVEHTEDQVKWDITPSEIPRLQQRYHADFIIHGHTHRPEIHLQIGVNHLLNHIVLSDWTSRKGNVLKLNNTVDAELTYF